MKKLISLCLTLLTATLTMAGGHNATPDTPQSKPAEGKAPFDVYLCIGQSNMEGNARVEPQDSVGVPDNLLVMCATPIDEPHNGRKMGQWYAAVPPLCRWYTGLTPADYFGREMARQAPKGTRVGIVMVACGGIGIEGLAPDTDSLYYTTAADWLKGFMDAYGRHPYQRLVDLARQAQRDGGIIRGILLHQGETNNGQATWPYKVAKIYYGLLADLELNAADVPLLAGETLQAAEGGKCSDHNAVIARLPEVIPTAHVVSSKGCKGRDDGLHFLAEGYRILGKRYAEVMLGLRR